MVSDADLLWQLGRRQARQALYWYRQDAASDPGDDLWTAGGDAAVAVWTWLYWHIGDPHNPASLERIGTQDNAPPSIPRQASAWERALLTAYLGTGPGDEDWERVCTAVISLVVGWIERADTDGDPDDGQILTSVEVADPVNLPGAGGVAAVACPVCGAQTGLEWLWDGIAARVACPCGEAEWTPLAGAVPVGSVDYEHITGRGAPPGDSQDTPPGAPKARPASEPVYGEAARELGARIGPEMATLQLLGYYYGYQLIIAAADRDWPRAERLLEEVRERTAVSLGGRFAWLVAMKLDGEGDRIVRAAQRGAAQRTREHAREEAAAVLRHSDHPLARAAAQVHHDDPAALAVLQVPPPDWHRAYAELTALAASVAAALTWTDAFAAPQMMLYELARRARDCAREAGLLPPSAPITVSERDARDLLAQLLPPAAVRRMPPLEACSPPERDMICVAQRHLLDGTPADDRLKPALDAIAEEGLAALRAARQKARQRAEHARRDAQHRQQPKKTTRKNRKK